MTDRYSCEECGADLPKTMVDGPIAGPGTEHPPIRLCGSCKAQEMLAEVNND